MADKNVARGLSLTLLIEFWGSMKLCEYICNRTMKIFFPSTNNNSPLI